MNKPEPLVPSDVDLTDFKFMPLEVARLLDSEWWTMACLTDPRLAMAAVNLWAKAWHQRPAASLPDKDAILAAWARVPLTVWHEIREAVMEPWVLCSDGRWYHPVVAEKANAAWEEKLAYQDRKRRWKESGQKGGLKRAQAPLEGTIEGTIEGTLQGTLQGTLEAKEERVKGESKGKGKDKGLTYPEKKELIPPADAEGLPPAVPKGEGYTPEFEAWWKLYPRKDEKGAAFRAFKTALKLVPVETLMAGVRAYAELKRREPEFIKHGATWLNGHCWNDEAPAQPARKHPPGFVPFGVGG